MAVLSCQHQLWSVFHSWPLLGCDKNYHKKCAYKVPNNCTRLKVTDGISNPPILGPNPKEVWSGRPLWIDKTLKSRQQVPHTFFVASYKNLTQCHHCKKVVSTSALYMLSIHMHSCTLFLFSLSLSFPLSLVLSLSLPSLPPFSPFSLLFLSVPPPPSLLPPTARSVVQLCLYTHALYNIQMHVHAYPTR